MSVRTQVWEWTHEWGPFDQTNWTLRYRDEFGMAKDAGTLEMWLQQIQGKAESGKRILSAMRDLLKSELPESPLEAADIWRQGFELTSVLQGGTAFLEARLSCMDAYSLIW
jgi:hypothetical protein